MVDEQNTTPLGIGAKVGLFPPFLVVADVVLCDTVSTCQGGLLASDPTSSPTVVRFTPVPGIATGALSNGERAVNKRGYLFSERVVHTGSKRFSISIYAPLVRDRVVGCGQPAGCAPTAGLDGSLESKIARTAVGFVWTPLIEGRSMQRTSK